jgi:hypothetical protein
VLEIGKLTKLEQLAFQGIMAREREIAEKLHNPLQADTKELTAAIATRLGLPPDALGTTHKIDFNTFSVMLTEAVPAPAATAEAEQTRILTPSAADAIRLLSK